MPVGTETLRAQRRARLGGSGFTIFVWDNKPIGFASQIAHTSPTPVGPGPTPIHPLDEPYPVEVLTPAAQNIGTLVLELYELYNMKVWDQLSTIAGSVDLVNIFIKVAARSTPIDLVKIIRPPTLAGTTRPAYSERYHNVVVTNVEDGETIEVGTMAITKRITVAYTYMTSDLSVGPNEALVLRDRSDITAGA